MNRTVIANFDQLNTKAIHAIYQLRTAVFVVEQNCPYQEVDDLDLRAIHVQLIDDLENLIGYARIIPPDATFTEPRIGRVVTPKQLRKNGYGKTVVLEAIHYCQQHYDKCPIVISAQLYLKLFYESFDFRAEGSVYLEDNIPHIKMRKLPLQL